jgi:hypothetical protein
MLPVVEASRALGTLTPLVMSFRAKRGNAAPAHVVIPSAARERRPCPHCHSERPPCHSERSEESRPEHWQGTRTRAFVLRPRDRARFLAALGMTAGRLGGYSADPT